MLNNPKMPVKKKGEIFTPDEEIDNGYFDDDDISDLLDNLPLDNNE